MRNVKKLTVKYNERTVGYLAEIDNTRIGFEYEDEWIKNGFSISPFSLPLKSGVFVNKKDNFQGLYGVFSDSLPDGWGELLVYRMLSKRGIDPNKLSPLTKLSLVSGQGLGGLSYEPCQFETGEDNSFELDTIAEDIRKILNDEYDNKTLDQIYRLGGSSGGARPKAHIKIDDEEWIIKFPMRYDSQVVGENEYKANLLAKKCGLNVNEFKLFKSNICSGYFGAKRFDRREGKRIHMISLSSLLETSHRIPNLDYKHLFQVIQSICKDNNDLYEAYGRMCFNVLYGNKDDHGKNFAFLYDESIKGYRLSPFYDITQTNDKLEHEMTVNGVGNPQEKDLLEIAKAISLSMQRCSLIVNKTKNVLR
ncbi:MAG TPA: toxin HipA [Firmicutes bacterium]|nr:toxin HipA [Bacillota bacterium]